jgi:hypothetical protein
MLHQSFFDLLDQIVNCDEIQTLEVLTLDGFACVAGAAG